MKKILGLLISVTFFATVSACAAISELKSLNDLDTSGWNSETLVIFDIDNTLLRQPQMIGTHQWGDYMSERAERRGVAKDAAKLYQYAAFADVQSVSDVVAVESVTAGVLQDLENRGISHFALTARPSVLINATLRQLQVLQHDFAKAFPAQKDITQLNGVLKNGVIFSGSTPKGELLKKIIENSVVPPKKIVFIDDKRYNLESVEASLAQSSVLLESKRYGATDEILNSFDAKLADIEYSYFKENHTLLSDEEAAQLVNSPEALTDLRFAEYVALQGPLVKAGECAAQSELVYKCEYEYDHAPASILFDYQRDAYTQGLYFGNW